MKAREEIEEIDTYSVEVANKMDEAPTTEEVRKVMKKLNEVIRRVNELSSPEKKEEVTEDEWKMIYTALCELEMRTKLTKEGKEFIDNLYSKVNRKLGFGVEKEEPTQEQFTKRELGGLLDLMNSVDWSEIPFTAQKELYKGILSKIEKMLK